MILHVKKYAKYVIGCCVLIFLIAFLIVFFKSSEFLNKNKDRIEIISVYHYNRDITGDILADDLEETLGNMRVARTVEVYAPYAQANVVWEVNLQLNGERWCVIIGNEGLNFAKGNGMYRKILNWNEVSDSLNNSLISAE